jgi:ADP-heptose:LPS heptosyltransferase
LTDFADAAALLSELDLLITVDTAMAHLAGALGIPVWVLLPHVADWRWLQEREDSPWYPTARLFRQPVAGDWGSVIERTAAELRSFIGRSVGTRVSADFPETPLAKRA